MCHCHRYHGVGLIVLGLIIGTVGAIHYFGGGCHSARRAQFEQHVAEVCIKAAEQVHK